MKQSRRSWSVALFEMAVAGALCSSAWAGGTLIRAAEGAPAPAALSREVLRARPVTIDLASLPTREDLALRGPATLTLRLFDDVAIDVALTRSAPGVPDAPEGARVLLGTVVGKPASTVWLSVHGDALVGDVSAPNFGDFQIRVAPTGGQIVKEIDTGLLNPCGNGAGENVMIPGMPWPNPEPAQAQAGARAGDERNGTAGTGPVVDMLIAWTPSARTSAGGLNGIQATIAGWVAATNQYYANSLIKNTIRAVRVQETNFVETASASTDLGLLRGTADGQMDELHAARDQWGADLVHLVSNSVGVCGIAYLMTSVSTGFASNGFGLTVLGCGSLTFAHEIGHNMGCAHDRQNGSIGAYCYSFGWRSTDNLYRTIMSYAPGSRLGYFSDPDIVLNLAGTNYRIGIDGSTCAADSCDNSRTHNNTAPTVALFRPTVVANDPPGAFAIVGPTPGATGVMLTPNLAWNPANNAGSYEVIVSATQNLASPLVNTTISAFTTNLGVAPGLLQGGTTYWWRVRALNSAGSTVATNQPSSFRTRLLGDVNGDGAVTFQDLNIVLGQFGQTGTGLVGDANGDGVVNFSDLNIVLSDFGRS